MIVKANTSTGRALLVKEATARVAALNLANEFKAQLPVGTQFILNDYPRRDAAFRAVVVSHSPELGEVVARSLKHKNTRRIPHKVFIRAIREYGLEIISKGEQP
ncbi:hypothetical protein [Cronobacter phage JC01]|uniref:Uncharacterized protein n=1 Tax=Cronobacter phage JC01 TaxID=2729575 RepID=A0A6M3YLQ3_9CAUD|nr:hypothetical protein JT331_gp41 [Cronobacter phage JC01]QJI52289.1 hypothetical protein [Cronobacter phage JC01]